MTSSVKAPFNIAFERCSVPYERRPDRRSRRGARYLLIKESLLTRTAYQQLFRDKQAVSTMTLRPIRLYSAAPGGVAVAASCHLLLDTSLVARHGEGAARPSEMRVLIIE
jgi:hypothetical protein